MVNTTNSLLEKMAAEFQVWFAKNGIEFVEPGEIQALLSSGIDKSRIWTYVDFWDLASITLDTGEAISFIGAGFVPEFDSDSMVDGKFAISKASIDDSSDAVYSEIVVACHNCDEDEDCDLCEGEGEVRYYLNSDGTFDAE